MDIETATAKLIREGIIGIEKYFQAPFGERKVHSNVLVMTPKRS
jgi:hypothetical protein